MTIHAVNDRVITVGGRAGRVLARIVGEPLVGYLVLIDGELAARRLESYEIRPEPTFGVGERVRDQISGKIGAITGYVHGRKVLVTLNGDGHPTVRRAADLAPLERTS